MTMTLANPIVSTEILRRWPFQRRPVPPPGTTIVFQRSNGELVLPRAAMLASDVSLRGLREMHVVNMRTHESSFQTKLPSKNIALQFDVSVTYSWTVCDPVRVVQQQVVDAPTTCQKHLERLIRPVCRTVDEADEGKVEDKLHSLPIPINLADHGLVVTAISFQVRSDAEVLELGREHFTQAGSLTLHQTRVDFFDKIVRNGTLVANIIAHDPGKAAEAAAFLDKQLENDRNATIEAMKILLEGGEHVHYGDLDDAVGAVIDRFRTIVARPTSITQPQARDQIEAAPSLEREDEPS